MRTVRIEYVSLSDLRAWAKNAKTHFLQGIEASVARFGFVVPIVVDDATGTVAAGHGRIEALTAMKAAGDAPPARVKVGIGRDWEVPVLRGVSFKDENDFVRYATASNFLVEKGGWDDEKLLAVLEGIAEVGMDGTGYAPDDVDALRTVLDMREKAEAKRLLVGKVRLFFAVEQEATVREALAKLKAAVPGTEIKEDICTN